MWRVLPRGLLASTALLLAAVVTWQVPHAQSEGQTYTIQRGDTLWGIAREAGCTIAELREANDLTDDSIYAGETLVIPDCEERPTVPRSSESESTYLIRPGDYLELIAANVGCSVAELMAANDLTSDVIYAGRTLTIPECTPREATAAAENQYVIQPGDYLGAIARLFGCSVSELRAANGLTGDLIRAGDTLTIPECTGGTRAAVRTIDTEILPRLMSARGFRPPRRFAAVVVEVTFDRGRRSVLRERWFDYEGTSTEDDWNPASTVKLYAAIAAMQRIRSLGFTGAAHLTFHGNRTDHEFTLTELVQNALTPSDNIAYNFLVQFVGFDQMNGSFLSRRNGFANSALRRAYERRHWMEMGESPSLRASPAITLEEGRRQRDVEARRGTLETDCSDAACTTLADLAECMRRLMLQEQLDASETFGLPREDLIMIRQALRADRTRGEEVVENLARSITGEDVYFYHKAGFAGRWYSDNVYIYDPHARQAWIVTLAGYPGRSSLDDAARIIGEIIAAGELRSH